MGSPRDNQATASAAFVVLAVLAGLWDRWTSDPVDAAGDTADSLGEVIKTFAMWVFGLVFGAVVLAGKVIPFLLGGILEGLAAALFLVAGGAVAVAAALRRFSDDPHERVLWAVLFAAVLIAALAGFGVIG